MPDVFHGIALRSTYARQQTHKLNVADYMQKWFGHMALGLHLGDFLQLRPAARRSIAERLEPKKEEEQEMPEEDAAENLKEEDTPAELGREAFHAGVNFVSLFTGTGRFSTCESGQKLVQILECMRLGRQMPRELWDELQKRQLVEDERDPRLDEPRFRNGHEGGFLWDVVGRLQHLRAIRDAAAAGQRIFYAQAVDVPTNSVEHFSPTDVTEALRAMNMTSSGYLMGMCPLFIGMQVRLSQNFSKPLLVREVKGTIRNIQFHPMEDRHWERQPTTQDAIVLRYLPTAVIVELDDKELKEVRFTDDLAPGYVMIGPTDSKWDLKSPVQDKKSMKSTSLERRQIPLAPQKVNTQFGLQGVTARQGMIAYLQKPPMMHQGDHWLATYVLLSRATKLDDLLISGLPPLEFFQQGPGGTLQKHIADFEERAKQDAAKADAMLKSLGWPSAELLAASWHARGC